MIKKFFKKFVCDIIYLIVNFIIKLPIFKKFQLVEINASRVANLIMETEIFYRESNSNKVYLIFFYKISNKYFVQLFLEKIKRNKKIIVLPGYFFWKKVCNAFYFSSKTELQFTVKNLRKKFSFILNQDPFLSLSNQDLERGYRIIKKYGIGKNDKWICVYNRDGAYLKSFIKNEDWTYHNFRNFPIKDLEKAINYFIKNKYFVIRVGSISEGTLNVSDNKYFDYSNSDIKSDFMDCFLLSKCEMFFGGSSGIGLLPASFRRPYFLINNCPLEGVFSIKRIYPTIFKRIKDLRTNKVLSIRQMIDRNLCNTFTSEGFDNKNVENLNNTEEEIKEFAIEALNILENSPKVEDKIIDHQKKTAFESEIIRDSIMKNLEYKNPIGSSFLEKTQIN